MQEEPKSRLIVLREAARLGIADIEAGRYRTFKTPAELREHMVALRDAVLSR
jgi:antitoxin ParD1/3/4